MQIILLHYTKYFIILCYTKYLVQFINYTNVIQIIYKPYKSYTNITRIIYLHTDMQISTTLDNNNLNSSVIEYLRARRWFIGSREVEGEKGGNGGRIRGWENGDTREVGPGNNRAVQLKCLGCDTRRPTGDGSGITSRSRTPWSRQTSERSRVPSLMDSESGKISCLPPVVPTGF